ncbi:MAG: DNA double-strand break repair nuclease NurA [Candidatus Aenigmarchaeota archaeon]|nr:DNA double-strand break repair nuclease NurA [Candidatus Aenigmarchaeota archaeon]
MDQLVDTVRSIAQRLAATDAQQREAAAAAKRLAVRVEPVPLHDVTVAGVDGGLVKRSLHGMDCLLVRAAAASFHYRDGGVAQVRYYPSRFPPPQPEVPEGLSEGEWQSFASLRRLREETGTAIAALEALRPTVLLMDGLLAPHPLDRPSPRMEALYQEVIRNYTTLYGLAVRHGIGLAGIVEDSRSAVFCDFLRGQGVPVPATARDTSFLSFLLDQGERTPPMAWPEVETFFLRTARDDRPLRVDYLPKTIPLARLAGLLLSVSGQHKGYGFPAPLIEADQVAKLAEEEMDAFSSRLVALCRGLPGALRLRRDQRPF